MVKINKKTCIGCGACAATCEGVFEMNDDMKAQVKKGADMKSGCIQDAIDGCPVDAISK
jgi:ferredoxin